MREQDITFSRLMDCRSQLPDPYQTKEEYFRVIFPFPEPLNFEDKDKAVELYNTNIAFEEYFFRKANIRDPKTKDFYLSWVFEGTVIVN